MVGILLHGEHQVDMVQAPGGAVIRAPGGALVSFLVGGKAAWLLVPIYLFRGGV